MIHIDQGNTQVVYSAIDSEVLSCIDKTIVDLNLNKKYPPSYSVLKRTLECILQITDKKLDMETMKSFSFNEICFLYIGALYSSIFYTSHHRKYVLLQLFLKLIKRLEQLFNAYPLPIIAVSTTNNTEDIEKCRFQFERITLNEEKLWLWQGWPCPNRRGRVYWAPLHDLNTKFGRSFTNSFHSICIEFVGGRNVNKVPCLTSLIKFISQYQAIVDVNDLKRPEIMGRFWRSFMKYYLISKYANGEGSKFTTLSDNWHNAFVPFAKSFLIPSGLFAEPFGEFPNFPAKNSSGANTHIRTSKNGEEVKVKLLTDIPLHLSDEESMHLLFKQIQEDVSIATNWASWASNDIWSRYQLRLENSLNGQIVKRGTDSSHNGNRWKIDRKNPNHLKNAAATLNYHGHIVNDNDAFVILPNPLLQTAYELGLPITGALLPHCILLIANHPMITPSFLENLQLYDKNGKQIGFIKTDSGYKLIGHKRRRGPNLAEQIISLNETTTMIVTQIIALTSSIREYLRSQLDDNWRYLLLTSKQGFSYPNRIKKISSETEVRSRVEKFAESLENTCLLNSDERLRYALRFNFSSLRASSGVLIYLQTRSINEMSKALGHAKVDFGLIERYLPEPILSFFQERWIRIFQAAILVEALKESPYLLKASGFKCIQELDEFLRLHALRFLDGNQEEYNYLETLGGESINVLRFGINTTILTLLISLQLAVQNATKTVHEKAKYWAELSKHLIGHIETKELNRPDLLSHLEKAKELADPLIMSQIIYG